MKDKSALRYLFFLFADVNLHNGYNLSFKVKLLISNEKFIISHWNINLVPVLQGNYSLSLNDIFILHLFYGINTLKNSWKGKHILLAAY